MILTTKWQIVMLCTHLGSTLGKSLVAGDAPMAAADEQELHATHRGSAFALSPMGGGPGLSTLAAGPRVQPRAGRTAFFTPSWCCR